MTPPPNENTVHRWAVRLRDMSATSAFFAMVVSGEVPIWVCAIFAVSAVLALLNVRVLKVLGRAALFLLAFVAAGLVFAVARESMDIVVAASSFAALLTAHRLLSEPTSETDDQVLLVSMLMISGGASLSGELLFAGFLFLFAILASLSRGLALLNEVNGAEAVPMRPVVRQLFIGCLAALAGAVVFFVVFPRLSWNVAARSGASGLGRTTTGFGDGVRLGGSGDLKTNPRPVFRVKISPDPQVDDINAYWVGQNLDTFDGKSWKSHQPGDEAHVRLFVGDPKGEQGIRQEIELLPAFDSTRIPLLERPLAVGPAVAYAKEGPSRLGLIRVRDVEVRLTTKPNSVIVTALSAGAGRKMDGVLPSGDTSRFLKLPENLDPRIPELARTILGDEHRPRQAAEKIQAYLLRHYQYTLELPGDVADPLANFLFERKAGHCEYFATAFAVLLRTAGIGSRVSTGFYGGQRSGDIYVIRAGDAHAWTQVLVPDVGFITLDATPPEHRSGSPSQILTFFLKAYERAEGWWRSSVLEFSILDQARMVRAFRVPGGSGHGGGSALPYFRIAVGILVAGALGAWLWRIWRGSPRRSQHEATLLLDAIEDALDRVAFPGAGKVPTEELVQSLATSSHPAANALRAPTQVAMNHYLRARFGGTALDPAQRRALARTVLNATRGADRG